MNFNFSIFLIYISFILSKKKDNIQNDDLTTQINDILEFLQLEKKSEFTLKECELILKYYLEEKNDKDKDDDDDNNDQLNQLDITDKVIKKIIGTIENSVSKNKLFEILNEKNIYEIEQDILEKSDDDDDNDDDNKVKNKKIKKNDDDDDDDNGSDKEKKINMKQKQKKLNQKNYNDDESGSEDIY